MKELTILQREVLTLRENDRLRFTEIARRLAISPSMVGLHYRNALQKLDRALFFHNWRQRINAPIDFQFHILRNLDQCSLIVKDRRMLKQAEAEVRGNAHPHD